MKQRLISLVLLAISLLPALVLSADPNLQRVLNLALSDGGPSRLNENDTYLIEQFNRVKNLSAVIPMLLNVNPKNLGQFQVFFNYFEENNIKVYPGLGNGKSPINGTNFKAMAKGYSGFTDCVQLNNVQKYYTSQPDNLTEMIDYLNNTLGFQHIQLNAWPLDYSIKGSPVAVKFSNPAVDSAQELVQLDRNKILQGDTSNTDWKINPEHVSLIHAAQPTAVINTNYENPGQEQILAKLNKTTQLNAFRTTISDCQTYANVTVRWTAPWSVNYDPIMEDTWRFMVRQLSHGNT